MCHDQAFQPYIVSQWSTPSPDVPRRARAALYEVLERYGCDDETTTDLVLAAHELIANANEHAVGPYEVRVRRTSRQIVCEVDDHSPRIPDIPVLPASGLFLPVESGRGGGLDALCELLSERGRGLHIVDELSNGVWGFRSWRGTKTAWLALRPPTWRGR
ncbi:ATP-binding protein [Streptomyces triticagri]|uniref:ATP-binding protein n=1 Tax=Streptomyces triticagri TaxID=2293568 RepID=UPI001F45A446|nr:ATP-binding protein [Streptomyces triticagri]